MPNKKMEIIVLFAFCASFVLIVAMLLIAGKLLDKEVLPECVHDVLCDAFDEPTIAVFVSVILLAVMTWGMTALIVATPPTDEWQEVAVVEYVDDICNDDGGHTVFMSNGTRFEVKCHCVEEYSIGDEYSRTVRKYLGFLTQKGEYKKTH